MSNMEQEKKIFYKIVEGKKYRVFKKRFNDNVFYNIQVTQKMYDGTVKKWYRPVTFKKGVELDDPDGNGIDIIIRCAYENLRENKKDEYNPITTLMVTDFELVERQEQIEAAAYKNYQENLNNEEEDGYVSISESDLPF